MNIRTIPFRMTSVALICSALAAPALAGLGSAPTPAAEPAVAAGARALSASRAAVFDGYTINEIATAGGGVIAEYVSDAGVVFGISWRSPVMPDLRALLGTYFPTFEQAAAASRATGRRGPIGIDSPDLVLQSAGQMRDYRGRAYVPGLLPPNVAPESIR